MHRPYSTFILSACSVLALVGCTSQDPTQWMPRGYVHQDDTPLSSPAPSAPWLKEAEISAPDTLIESSGTWQASVFELVGQLQDALPQDGTALYVSRATPFSGHNAAMDHYIRQVLMQKGYTLTTTAGAGPTITVAAKPLTDTAAMDKAMKEAHFVCTPGVDVKDTYLLNAVLKNADGTVAKDSSVTAVLPGEKTEYRRLPGYSVLPAQGLAIDQTPKFDRQ